MSLREEVSSLCERRRHLKLGSCVWGCKAKHMNRCGGAQSAASFPHSPPRKSQGKICFSCAILLAKAQLELPALISGHDLS